MYPIHSILFNSILFYSFYAFLSGRGLAAIWMDEGAPVTQNGGRALVVALKKLQPGTYTVDWQVTSVDTHKTKGRFTFTVGS